MEHWFIRAGHEPACWREAFPLARVLGEEQLAELARAENSIVWCCPANGRSVEEAVAGIRQYTTLPLVILRDEPAEGEVLAAVAAGASAYCNSRAAPEVLQQVARVVENGGLWVGQALLQRLVGGTTRILAQRQKPEQPRAWRQSLSEREIEVAQEVAAGASNKEISDRLGITERTVKAHLTAIFEKLGVRDRLQLSLHINL